MSEGVVSVNVVNFVTVGVMALVFVALAKFVKVKTGWNIPLI